MTCIGKDPRCPCQDGDACHYKDCGGTKALPVPVAQPEQEPVAYYHPHKGFYWAKPTHISAPTVVDVPPMPLYASPPAAQPEPPPEWEAINNILNEYGLQAIDFVADWRAAQRPCQGLTEEDVAIAFAEFDLKSKMAFRAGMYKAQIILRKKNDSTY